MPSSLVTEENLEGNLEDAMHHPMVNWPTGGSAAIPRTEGGFTATFPIGLGFVMNWFFSQLSLYWEIYP